MVSTVFANISTVTQFYRPYLETYQPFLENYQHSTHNSPQKKAIKIASNPFFGFEAIFLEGLTLI
jgi:hypothetical protein